MSATADATAELRKLEEDFRNELAKRMESLRPAHEAYLAYEARLRELDGAASSNGGKGRTTRAKTGTRRGTRMEQFVAVVREKPQGLTVTEIAAELGQDPNYFYRIRNDAEKRGLIRTDGPKVFPTDPLQPSPERVEELEAAAASS